MVHRGTADDPTEQRTSQGAYEQRARALGVVVGDAKRDRGTHAREAVDEHAEEGAVAKADNVETSMPSSSVLVSFAESTGVLPVLTTCFGPRTELAGLNGRTWCSRRRWHT